MIAWLSRIFLGEKSYAEFYSQAWQQARHERRMARMAVNPTDLFPHGID